MVCQFGQFVFSVCVFPCVLSFPAAGITLTEIKDYGDEQFKYEPSRV